MLNRPLLCFCISFFLVAITGNSFAQAPVANFGASPLAGCSPLTVNFQDQSTGNPTSWSWNLGNANSNLQNPSNVYINPGTYTVSLTVTNANGSNSIVKTQYITVYDTPTVNMTSSQAVGCRNLTVSFQDQSSISGSTITEWTWDFGDGSISNLQNPTHTYTASGSYSVKLTVKTAQGCTKTRVYDNYVIIHPRVIPSFTNTSPSTCTPPISVNFTNTSNGIAQSYLWNFGDGQTNTATHPTHNYNAAGVYTVTLITTTAEGCKDTLVRPSAVVIGNVDPNFNMPDSVCQRVPVQMINATSPIPASVSWQFGDGTFSQAYHPVHTYTTAGTYNVRLTVVFPGCTTTKVKPITVLSLSLIHI